MAESPTLDARLAQWSFRHGPLALVATDGDGAILVCNPVFSALCGRRAERLKGGSLFDALRQPPRSPLAAAYRDVLSDGAGQAVVSVSSGPGEGADQQWRFRLSYDEESKTVYAIGVDLTLEHNLSAEVKNRTVRDRLTGLENRDALVDELQTMIRTGQSVALFFVDVDRFAAINDTYGHDLGDAVLIVLARRLTRVAGPREIAARIGGDQFAVAARRLDGEEAAAEFARRLHVALSDEIVIDRTSIHPSVSVGYSFTTSAGKDGSTMLREADTALARAADQGGNRIQHFEPVFHEEIERRVRTEADLRRAIGTLQLDADVQGVFDADRQLMGFEALARWRHPDRGTVLPAEFIDVADRFGLLDPVLAAVLNRSLVTLGSWLADGSDHSLAINLAPSQLFSQDAVDIIEDALGISRVEPNRLVVEVTERELVTAPEAIRTLERLAERGIRIAIDDFGAGASSLGYLWTLPVSVLKLDRLLTRSVTTDPNGRTVVASLIDLGRRLNLAVIAEGVETEAEFAQLVDLGCQRFQGYLLHRPSPLKDAGQLIHGSGLAEIADTGSTQRPE